MKADMEAYWLQEGPEEWKKNGQLICELAIGGTKLFILQVVQRNNALATVVSGAKR